MPIDTARSAARERIAEIGEILTIGLIRLGARQSRQISAESRESSLDCLGTQSGDDAHVVRMEPRS
jgi:hypothetical protein